MLLPESQVCQQLLLQITTLACHLCRQLHVLQQQLSLSKDAEANAAKLQASNTALKHQAQQLEERITAAMQQSGQMQQQYQDEVWRL